MARATGIAVWTRIAAQLREDIASGAIAPGGRLPPEAALASRFAVNRHTVRRALEDLARDRLIRIEHGRGSFVAEPVLDYQINLRPRFSEWVRRHNREPFGDKLSLRMIDPADLPECTIIREVLGLAAGEPVLELLRRGTADARPLSLSRHIFPARLEGLHAALLNHATITAALAQIGIADYLRLRSRITCRMPTPRECALLELERDAPVLHCENVNVTAANTPLELCFAIYPSHRVALIVEPTA
ncbi:MAG: phosphonate metabolism transcriptional regulator PhnF [Proteobacteria bacterium]|nr:phosphonate metabolism transcriptional regulator PhnF [Pseudomonadota bacterium]